MAQNLNKQFSSVFIRENTNKLPTVDTGFKNGKPEDLRQLTIKQSEIVNKIKGMKY